MANEKHIKNYTAADIEKYHHGLLSSKERHDLEKAALDDPFLADALEGYSFAGINISADLKDLGARLQGKVEGAKVVPIAPASNKGFPWLRAAVAIILILGGGLLIYQLAFNNSKKQEIAVTNKPDVEKNTVVIDSNKQVEVTTPANTPVNKIKEETGSGTDEYVTINPNGRSGEVNHVTAETPIKTDISVKPGTDTIGKYYDRTTTTNPVVLNSNASSNYRDSQSTRKDNVGEGFVKTNDDKYKAPSAKENAQVVLQENDALARTRANTTRRYEEQQRNNIFRGRVVDADNNGLPFARVTNTEDNVGTYADAKGNFNLVSPDSVLNVQVVSLGFNNLNYQLRNGNGNNNNQVVMQGDKSLNEVVISNKKINTVARTHNANVKLEEPEPADGWDNYDTYIANNLDVPEEFREKPTNEAVVEISFEVDKNGQPVNIRVEKSLCAKCDEEAKRLIKQGPKWIRNAKKGRTTVKIPFSSVNQ